MICVDLHLHSTFSDGSMTPRELVEHGKSRRVSVMSLTDHDTVEGLPSFMAACKGHKIAGVPGIELSAEYEGTLHILGYRLDMRRLFGPSPKAELLSALEDVRRGREARNEKMCDNLQDMGLEVSLEEVAMEAGGDVVGRPHMARVLVRKGYSRDMLEAFERYLGAGAPAYEERYRLPPERCIELIGEAGGLAVLAHPALTTEDEGVLRAILGRLREAGLWGMECVSPSSSPERVFQHMSIASEFSLFPTAGSDFHGENRPSVSMGVTVEEGLLPWTRLGVSL
ncbi:MAG: PHP domain-containing protein [Synergistaceae bacterium]|nr:PHP domain-containing protein [Synergistota bacterium]NLM71510.1 PHP domain-containing protein [Synergistaceae bacterium]